MSKQLRVGGIDYRVKVRDNLCSDDGTKLNGSIDYFPDYLIQVEGTAGKQVVSITVWHEIVHGILRNASRGDKVNDKTIDVIACGIFQALRDNPQLKNIPKWLNK